MRACSKRSDEPVSDIICANSGEDSVMLMSFSRIWCSISSRSDVAFFFHSLMVQRVLYRVSTQTICAAAHCRSGKQGHRYRRKTPHSEGNGTMMHTDRRAESCSGKTPRPQNHRYGVTSLRPGRAAKPFAVVRRRRRCNRPRHTPSNGSGLHCDAYLEYEAATGEKPVGYNEVRA